MPRSLFIGSLLALFALPAAAQLYTSPDPVIRAIWNEGMDNSQLPRMAQALLDAVGPRLTGSPGVRAGNDWLVKPYASGGGTARKEQCGTGPAGRSGGRHSELRRPSVRAPEGGVT